MKVRFLKDGLYAHSEPGRGNFECKKGETMSGLAEATCKDLTDSGHAEVLGADDEEKEEEKTDDETKDAILTSNTAPWSK